MRDVSVGPWSRNAMQRFPSLHPSIHPYLSALSVAHPSLPWYSKREEHADASHSPSLSISHTPSSLCSICNFIFLVFFYFVVQHLTVSHTICLLSLSFCLLQCAIEILAFKNTDDLLLTLRWLLWCALEIARAFWVVPESFLVVARKMLACC